MMEAKRMATKVQDYRLVMDEDNLRAECHFPSISYDDFDRAGGICPWKICRMFEAGRSTIIGLGDFLNIGKLAPHASGGTHTFFLLGGDYYFDHCIWDVARKHSFFPYKVVVELISVGGTSITYRQILVNELDNRELATFYYKMVYVNAKTRRPEPLPSWFRDKSRPLQGKTEGQAKVLINSGKPVPKGAFQAEALVQPSDTDFNGHTNQASYVRFCMDAAEVANRAGAIGDWQGDICRYPILKISQSYSGETNLGDRIMTSVWQDDSSPWILHFAVCRGENVSFEASITFKSRHSSKL